MHEISDKCDERKAKDTPVEYSKEIDNIKTRIWLSYSVSKKGDCEIPG